jgi:malonyl-CoA/methylmalonyl-CoA synthetase
MPEIITNAFDYQDNIAVVDQNGKYSYGELIDAAFNVFLEFFQNENDLNQKRVAIMIGPGFEYVAAMWGIWMAGGVVVPLSLSYPIPSLKYVLEDSETSIVIAEPAYFSTLKPLIDSGSYTYLDIENIIKVKNIDDVIIPNVSPSRNAMILYTSGTTNLPKGVVITHSNLTFQIKTLIESWEWDSKDHIFNVLPLHHVHGIVNVLCCALWAGATVEFSKEFSAERVFERFVSKEITLFMAVPTIYFKLISFWENSPQNKKDEYTEALKCLRLMVSGSAALPVSIMDKWKIISGHTLLERYGMTEIGMAISNPYKGERKAGYIGLALPGVQVRLVDEDREVLAENVPGEIQIKGGNVFKAYWNKPEATAETFTDDGWFKTGDVAVVEDGYYRILGRNSVDIIKSGGYKISALEVEEVLRQNELIEDCAVVGLPDEEWGELVAAALVPKIGSEIDTHAINDWIRNQMPAYKVPRDYKIVADLPRNAMGKVTKKEVKEIF